jgi:hypothetical protein
VVGWLLDEDRSRPAGNRAASQSIGGGVNSALSLALGPDNRGALRRLLQQVDLDEQVRRRAVQDAIGYALADQWRRRAEVFEWAAPKPGDFLGKATSAEVAEAVIRCRESAQACLNRAALIELEAADDGD